VAHVRFFAALLHQLLRDGPRTLESAEAALDLCREQGYHFYLGLGMAWRGWALAQQGRREEGLEQMRQGRAACQATGAEICGAQMLGMLAEVLGQDGQITE